MPSFGKKSRSELETAHPDLQALFNKVVDQYDCSVLQGHRTRQEQDAAFANGNSTLRWPKSKHNTKPSMAVDVVPYPIDWGNTGTKTEQKKAINRFYHFAGYVLATADSMNIKVRWGGDWDGDKMFTDQKFDDLPHWELLDD